MGDTVEYKITVKNIGETNLKFETLKDTKCTNFSPALAPFELAPAGEKVYTCEHVLVTGDGPIYKNVAVAKASEKEKPSEEPEVEVKELHEFEIHKEQRIAGEGSFTTAKLSSEAGKKVEYQIVVKNTGNTTLKFGALKDAKCSNILPAGETTPESWGIRDVHVRTHADRSGRIPLQEPGVDQDRRNRKTVEHGRSDDQETELRSDQGTADQGRSFLHEAETVR